jgi:deazaflavin-dependent oxidoreductase (nitroreductase family)
MAEYLFLTTTGRRTGLRRKIEIWFTERDGRFYVIAEHRERAQWLLNILADPHVHVRVGNYSFAAVFSPMSVSRNWCVRSKACRTRTMVGATDCRSRSRPSDLPGH